MDPINPWDVYKSVHFLACPSSTTEPPCFKDVNWCIMDVTMTISHPQLAHIKKLMFNHVYPAMCARTCWRSDYMSDQDRMAIGRMNGFVLDQKRRGVDRLQYI